MIERKYTSNCEELEVEKRNEYKGTWGSFLRWQNYLYLNRGNGYKTVLKLTELYTNGNEFYHT